jgi:hypothetical protein
VIDYQKITGFSSLPSCGRLRSGVQLFTTEIYIFCTLIRVFEGILTTVDIFALLLVEETEMFCFSVPPL